MDSNQNPNRFKLLKLAFVALRGAILGFLIGVMLVSARGYFLLRAARDSLIQNGNGLEVGTWPHYLNEYIVYKIAELLAPLPGALTWLGHSSQSMVQAAGMWNLDMHMYGQASVEYWLLQNQGRAYSTIEISVGICMTLAILIYIVRAIVSSKNDDD
ncbi:MAG: hypothetical protein M0Z99_34565 [Betaproteobacteria bacterium]|nr:hypothetical protein [Betaproteobacteria bacterium]